MLWAAPSVISFAAWPRKDRTLDHKEFELTPVVCESREAIGSRAGKQAADILRSSLRRNGHARLMLASAESQRQTLTALSREQGIDWTNVECYHMDEYLGLPIDASQGFANWLQATFLDTLPVPPTFHRIRASAESTEEVSRYEKLLGTEPFDLVLLGLGVSGHLAFNDPPANLSDRQGVRIVELNGASRQQQVDEGHFVSLADVPVRAITVTIPRLLNTESVIASVPGETKRRAVFESLTMPISGDYPGTALRTHPNVSLYVDTFSDPGALRGDVAEPLGRHA